MDLQSMTTLLRQGVLPQFPPFANSSKYAASLDEQDPLKHLRDEFILPTKASLRKRSLDGTFPGYSSPEAKVCNGHTNHTAREETSLYFVGNSLGPQPKAVKRYVDAQLETWASIGVSGHFSCIGDSPLVPWQDMALQCANQLTDLIGASSNEIVVMNTLSANLHLMMAAFYQPTERRHKIILEWRPFPSDYYVIESQIQWHGLDPKLSMIQIQPDENSFIPTEQILATIDQHAEETAMILLPGVQYYSGQLLDIENITKYAQSRGIIVGWDLAHAAGNVELRLHDWNVDWACWCTYKYINAGPGAIAGTFVHERHGTVDYSAGPNGPRFRPRLTGWYGHDKDSRFDMDNMFKPSPGAAGYQLSNPSAIDLACLSASLSVFEKTNMHELRSKSLVLTAYAQHLLDVILIDAQKTSCQAPFRVITPRDPLQRGTQLSVLLRKELMDQVSAVLVENGVVCDKRKPGVIRVAPVALYTRFEDVFRFMRIFREALGL